MAKKVQLPVIGGIRKVITPGGNQAVGTTIAELGSSIVTLAQLAALLGVTSGGGTGGGAGTAFLSPGPGLSGGGALVGNVGLYLTAPIPSSRQGDQGEAGRTIPGATGKQGIPGVTTFMRGSDGENGRTIPGPSGASGVNASTIYLRGQPGDDGFRTIASFLNPSGVIPGSYTSANITVDFYGRVTAAANGSGGGGSPGAPNTSVQFNNSGSFGGSANFEWNGTTVAMTATTINTMMSIGGAAATNISLITAQQSGQAAWLMYLPASTSDLRFYNSVNGDAFIIDDIGDLYSITNSSAFGGTYGAVVGLRLNNLNAAMQTSIEFAKSSVLMGRIRSDYAGNLSYVTTAGNHTFFNGGDSGTGSETAVLNVNQLQVTRLGSVANSSFAAAGRAILMLNGSSDNLIDFSDNTANRGYLYAVSTEMRVYSAAGVVSAYAAGGLVAYSGVYAAFTNASSLTGAMVIGTGTWQKNDPRGGYIDGNYPTHDSGAQSGCIYSIGGGTYVPGASSLGNVYGIGYTIGNVTGMTAMGQTANWGLWVANSGAGNIFLEGAGNGWFSGTLTALGALQVASGNVTGGFTVGGALTCSNFITGAYLESTSANNENPTVSQVMVTNGSDNFLRKDSLANFASQLAPATNSSAGKITINGIIIQWGSGTASAAGTSNSYPSAFPTGVYQVVWTEADGVISGAYSSSLTKTSASAFTAYTGKGSAITISWMAIGH